MSEKCTIAFAVIALAILIPYGVTMWFHGKIRESKSDESHVIICYEEQGKEVEMGLEKYLIHTLPTQIPVDYELEMLKAQAVIARTNIMRMVKEKGTKKIQEKELGMTHLSTSQMKEFWAQSRYEEIKGKLEQVVYDTTGITMKYENDCISAVFHRVSSGETVAAKDAYGTDTPYLASVKSSQDVEAKEYLSTKVMSYEQFLECLKKILITGTITKEEDLAKVKITEKTRQGYVKKVEAFGKQVQGNSFAEAMGLPSHNYYLEPFEKKIRFVCLGVGHGMGLSQYGGNNMAKQGKQYETILSYYYKNIKIGV